MAMINDPEVTKERYLEVASKLGLTKRELELGFKELFLNSPPSP